MSLNPDPFLPENNGGLLDHPRLTDGDGLLAPPQNSDLIHSLPDREYSPRGCVACGGAGQVSYSYHPAAQALKAPVGPFILPLPASAAHQKIEIHTLRFGNPDWMAECAPTLDDWCRRHGLPLKTTATWDKSYPDPKFCEVDMLRAFLAGDSEWMMYVDADVVVHPLAPRPCFTSPGFHIRPEIDRKTKGPWIRPASWVRWCADRFSREPGDWIYRNAGVWACDRAAAAAMLAVIEKPYHLGIMEQHHLNWWIHEAARLHVMPVVNFGKRWNLIPGEVEPAWFFHIYSKNKWKNLLNFRNAGLLPDAVKPVDAASAPPIPDFGEGAVVWPYLSGAAQWDELWFSHRSVIEHWSEKDWPLVLIGDAAPAWWPEKFIHAPRYEDALWIGTQCAEQVLWMNDDIFLLAGQSPADLVLPRHLGDMEPRLGATVVALNSWRRGLGQVLMRCHHHGRPTHNFSTHTPYLYQRSKAREIFERFGNYYKMPFETAYFNWHRQPAAPCEEKAKGPHDLDGKLWINPRFTQLTAVFRAQMAARFGPPLAAAVETPSAAAPPAPPISPPPAPRLAPPPACLHCARK